MEKILVIGALGQIGSELVPALRAKFGKGNVIASDVRKPDSPSQPFEILDATDKAGMEKLITTFKITQIYHLASLLSATGEKNPDLAWHLNLGSLKHVLDLAVKYKVKRVFWPSSIAAFGPTTPRVRTPQRTILEPTTMYGVTKVAGELLCQYYFQKYGLDVRSVRYPGLISYKALPGGGTTDFAVAIFYDAIEKGKYECFVGPKTTLPMMYMDDAIKGTIQLMDAPASKISVRTSYNLAAVSFSAEELATEVKKLLPKFTCTYKPDARQKIADSWPESIDDAEARKDWGWKHEFDLSGIAKIMLKELKEKLKVKI